MKKIISVILCAAMVLASAAMVFAGESEMPVTALPADDVIMIEPQSEPVTMVLPGEAPLDIDLSKLEQFNDVDPSAWYADGIAWCVGRGILSGKSDVKMAPFDKITRAEIVTMLWRVEGKPVVNFFMRYNDVSGDEYYGEAVRWATALKVTEGYDDGTFKPAKTITRQELAQIIYNYAKLKGNGFTGSWMFLLDFEDQAEVAPWANEAMHWCVMKQIISGSDGKLLPRGLASRAEAAAMFMRLNPEAAAEEVPDVPLAGGWNTYTGEQMLDTNNVPEEAMKAFDMATEGLTGAAYTPVAYIGSQVVAGVNYKFICEVKAVVPNAEPKFKEVAVFRALDGTAAIISAEDITADFIENGGSILFPTEGFAGGYYYGDAAGSIIESNIAESFAKATEGLDGVHYEPLAVIGQQVVAGMNYVIVVKATTVTPQPESAIGVVKLYAGVDGTNTMTIMGNLK